MAITYKEYGLTEQEIINLPKVNKGSLYIGEKDVFLKKKKNDILNLGSKELFRDIHNIFNFDTGTEIFLFLALCGNEEVTSFTGDPQKELEKMYAGVHSSCKNNNADEYLKETREERQGRPLYGTRRRRVIKSKSYVKEELKRLAESGWYSQIKDNYEKELPNLTDDIIKLLLKGNYNIIRQNIEPSTEDSLGNKIKKGTQKYYKEVAERVHSCVWYMTPTVDNNSTFGLKVKHIRDKHNMGTRWVIGKRSSFDVKTGEVVVYLTNSLQDKEINVNIYTDDVSNSEYRDELSLPLLLNIVLDNYTNTNLNRTTIMDIVGQTLEHEHYRYYRGMPDHSDVYEYFYFGAGHNKLFEDDEFDTQGKENYLEVISQIVKNIDKLNNLDEYELFDRNYRLINIPKKSKWKVQDVFNLTKQTYKKLLTLNNFEQRNYLRFSETMLKHYSHLANEVNLHQLFDDVFLMVQDSGSVSRALQVSPIVNEVIPISFSDYKKMVHYLDVDAQDRQRIVGFTLNAYYQDYLNDLAILVREGYRTIESVNLTPFSLKLEHDIVTDEKQSIQNQLDDKELEYKYQGKLTSIIKKTYTLKDGTRVKFLPADTVNKLKYEGKSLSHCVGGYANRIMKNSCLILLARLEDDLDNSWFTVEIRITDNGYVLGQQQSIKEYKLPTELKSSLEKDIKKINKEEFKESA